MPGYATLPVPERIRHLMDALYATTSLQLEPEAHQDLIVRVAGYSAYFTQLGWDVQPSRPYEKEVREFTSVSSQ